MRRALLFVGLLLVHGCPNDEEACNTTQDCFDQGRTLTQCIDGQCQRQCEYDLDCQYLPGSCAQDDQACKDELKTLVATKFVCEDFVCTQGCPDSPCPNGSSCFEGRCAYYNESFEAESEGDFLTLQSLGWNATDRVLSNNRLLIAWSGDVDCEFDGDRDRCAGPAADGAYFAVLESSQATAGAPRELGMTCRDCACCLACRDPFARTSS